ncbi:MAG TPA: M1 family metallopeptidase [Ferruginibacter sp.]|nr:M1 family metallopeptidase [Ferruginibacter sp.]
MRLSFSAIALLLSVCVYAQPLFVSRDIQEAYKKETRSKDGRPGKNYWQNRANYTMEITAMVPSRNISGKETIEYFNESPDTLRSLFIKLFLNVHKPGAPREFPASKDYLTEGLHIDEVTINGIVTKWKGDGLFTSEQLRLKEPLFPKGKLELGFKWHYEISKESGREGMIDSTTYFLAYFYPRVSVYDDYNGWDNTAFTDSREFYSDFNNYDVSINVPANYIVWGTGTLQQPEKLLKPAVLQRYQQSLAANEVVNIATQNDISAKSVTLQNEINEWRFTGTHLPDVAFGISDHYLWDGSSVVVDDATGRRASAQAAYAESSKDYQHVSRFTRNSLHWFSNNWPGIAYPYEKMTIFQGFADMEYPMMANNSSFTDTSFSKFVAEHEIAHSYMPFYMGINETRYGCMDEGWATVFEYLIGIDDMGEEKASDFFKRFRVNSWINSTSPNQLIPIIAPADGLTFKSFGNNIYGKPAVGYLALKDLLGDDLFKKCLQEFMKRWNGKHPMPWDMFYTFNDVSGKNLDWFWRKWFFDPSYIDIAIQSVQQQALQYSITLQNIGGMPAAVNIVLNYTDGTKESIHQTPAIWEKNQEVTTVNLIAKKQVQSLLLEGGIYMDADKTNNEWKNKNL